MEVALLVLPHEKLYLDHLPSADRYSKSFMHRDVINFVVMTRCVRSASLALPGVREARCRKELTPLFAFMKTL